MKTNFDLDGKGLSLDIGDLSDPKFSNPITKDLIRKTWDDYQRAMDRSMTLASDFTDDTELEVFIKNSIMVSTSTNAVSQCINFMIYSQSLGHVEAEDLSTDIYMTKVVEHLALIAQVIMKGHLSERVRRGKAPLSKKGQTKD